MYFPLVAFAAAAALLLARVQMPAGPAVAVLLAAIAMARTQVWMTERSLWSEAVRQAPEKLRPKIQLARALPPAEALDLLAKARQLAPNDPEVATETGKMLMAEGQLAPALAEFGRALALDPHDARNFNNRGVALAALGQLDAARADFERALALDPSLGEARENLKRLAAQ
jgi:Flp pilus assembly protein TadD